MDKKHYVGFVPQYVPVSQEQCAHYHCTEKRIDYRRYCKKHSKQYDQEAEKTPCRVLPF